MKKYKVNNIFKIVDKGYIIVHLEAASWKNCQYKEVKLVINEKKYSFEYGGFGNMKGVLMIKLLPTLNMDISAFNFKRNDIEKMYIEVHS